MQPDLTRRIAAIRRVIPTDMNVDIQHHPAYASLVDEILSLLLGNPFGELRQAFRKIFPRLVTQLLLDPADVGDAMTNVADARLAGDLRSHRTIHRPGQKLRHFGYGSVLPASDIVDAAGSLLMLERQDKGLRHVFHVDEIASLLTVFKDHRRLSVVKPRREDGKDAGIGV